MTFDGTENPKGIPFSFFKERLLIRQRDDFKVSASYIGIYSPWCSR